MPRYCYHEGDHLNIWPSGKRVPAWHEEETQWPYCGDERHHGKTGCACLCLQKKQLQET